MEYQNAIYINNFKLLMVYLKKTLLIIIGLGGDNFSWADEPEIDPKLQHSQD